VDIPGLVIAGQDDHWIPMTDVQAAVDRLPDVELHVLPDCGHLLHEEAPREVSALLRPFLRKHLLPEANDTPGG
jgi:pimeloyl-ACP methyl ester carboxylesterase